MFIVEFIALRLNCHLSTGSSLQRGTRRKSGKNPKCLTDTHFSQPPLYHLKNLLHPQEEHQPEIKSHHFPYHHHHRKSFTICLCRGGGLLKYCNLLVKNYRPAWPEAVKTMERYMCSRYLHHHPLF